MVSDSVPEAEISSRRPKSSRCRGGHSSLIKIDVFSYQNRDLEASGSEGSFGCPWPCRLTGSRRPRYRLGGQIQPLGGWASSDRVSEAEISSRKPNSSRWEGGHSSLIKIDGFSYQNRDLEASGSEGSFGCPWPCRPTGSRRPRSRLGGRIPAVGGWA
jgi:hypothetical protein